MRVTRRDFLSRTAVAFGLAPLGFARPAQAIEPFPRTRPSHLKLSIAAFSYRRHLTGANPSMDLFDFVNRAADLALDAVEPTSYYFPKDVSNDYLHRLKEHAFRLGLDISGTAIMNDFCLPAGPERERDLEHVRAWIDHAAELDAPTIRLLSGNWRQGVPDEDLENQVVQGLQSLLPYAIAKGVTLALENHGGGVTVSPEQLLRITRKIQGPNYGVNLDTFNFHGPDPYADVAQLAPYAVNVQVKTEIRRRGRSKEPADLGRFIEILRKARYSGYVVLEYDAAEDPYTAVPRAVKELRSLIG